MVHASVGAIGDGGDVIGASVRPFVGDPSARGIAAVGLVAISLSEGVGQFAIGASFARVFEVSAQIDFDESLEVFGDAFVWDEFDTEIDASPHTRVDARLIGAVFGVGGIGADGQAVLESDIGIDEGEAMGGGDGEDEFVCAIAGAAIVDFSHFPRRGFVVESECDGRAASIALPRALGDEVSFGVVGTPCDAESHVAESGAVASFERFAFFEVEEAIWRERIGMFGAEPRIRSVDLEFGFIARRIEFVGGLVGDDDGDAHAEREVVEHADFEVDIEFVDDAFVFEFVEQPHLFCRSLVVLAFELCPLVSLREFWSQ